MSHHILPGSLEVNADHIIAAVHTGASEWEVENLRYIRLDLNEATPKVGTVIEGLVKVYDNSTGCLMKGDFKA